MEKNISHSSNWLLSYQRNVQSKEGEDGIIEKIFEIIGEKSKWCVELGALTGTYGSNIWNLIKNREWNGVLIEAETPYFEQLQQEYKENKHAICINTFVSFEGKDSLDSILSQTSIPKEFDLLSLDIDGNDYHVWESLKQYRPRVVVIEFNPSIPNEISFVQPRDMSINQGSSLRALVNLGKEKGYEIIAANKDNAFFVSTENFSQFGMDNCNLDLIHQDRSCITYFFQLYDGTIKLYGNKSLLWHQLPIQEDKLQILPKYKRYFPNRISPSNTIRRIKYFVRKLPFYSLLQKIRKLF